MSFVFVDPDAVQAAARQLTRIGWQLDAAAKVAVAVQQVAPAAADEVSGACAATFSGFAEQYSARLAQAVSLHERFIASLTAGAGSYSVSEAAAVTSWGGLGVPERAAFAPPAATVNQVTLVVSGTGYSTLPPALPAKIGRVYLPGAPSPSLLSTPEQFWPFTPQLGSLTLDPSAALGAQHLNTAILSQFALGHSDNVWGTSQGSLVVTDDIRWLMAHGSPGTSQVKFVLTGDPGNPDGGTTHCPRPESSNNP